MRVAIFGGSFDPVHSEHVRLVQAAKEQLGLDKILVMPAGFAPHKNGAVCSGKERAELLRIAFRRCPYVEVSEYELDAAGKSYSYLTCRWFEKQYPEAERYFLVGADMLENFPAWKNPQDILSRVRLAACGRASSEVDSLHESFISQFGCDFVQFDFIGGEVSSTLVRTELAFGKSPASLDLEVLAYVRVRGLYTHPAILPALALEKEARREHSFRVAKLSTARAKSAGVSEQKALLAAALHDCAKYLPMNSPYLAGFTPPCGVPEPVMHQYAGAYVAEHHFGIDDEEVLDAIRFHASGREDMTTLGKLVYLADLLEEDRDFPHVEELRLLFWQDLDVCLEQSLAHQLDYLKGENKPVYPLTEAAYRWIKAKNTH